MSSEKPKRYALLSVTDKEGIIDLAKCFLCHDIGLISTGGTATKLRDVAIPVMEVSKFTGFAEAFGGRFKSMHPLTMGGILFRRDNPEDVAEAQRLGFPQIDFVVVNLYEFAKTIKKPNITLAEAIEQIDIGGPTMLRSAAKNWRDVTVLSDPTKQYAEAIKLLNDNGGETTPEFRFKAMCKAFRTSMDYEDAISSYLDRQPGSDAPPGWLD